MTAQEKKSGRQDEDDVDLQQLQHHKNLENVDRRSCIIPLDIPQVDDNVYGQIHPIETPSLLAEKEMEFDQAVEELVQSKKAPAVQSALEKCPNLLTSAFKLLFLRCEVFNINRTVKRYAKYWKKRVELFGPEKAFLPLTWEGALKGDEDALRISKAGFVDITGTKDYLGRRVLFLNYARFDPKDNAMSRRRAFWYVLHQVLEDDEETQKYGVVFMVYTGKKMRMWDFDMKETSNALDTIQGAIPARLAAFHICFPLFFVSPIVAVLKLFMSVRLRKRIILHSGSVNHVKQRLATPYGLDSELNRCHDHV